MDDVRVRDLAQHLHLQRQHLLVARLRQGQRGHAVSSLPRCTARAERAGRLAGGSERAVGQRTSSFFLLMILIAHMCPVDFSLLSFTCA